MLQYFAYGSNLDFAHLARLGIEVLAAERGILRGWRLTFNVVDSGIDCGEEGVGLANLERCDRPAPNAASNARMANWQDAEGAILTLDARSLPPLDAYENYPIDYDRQILDILNATGQMVPCWVYFGQPNCLGENLKPTRPFLQKILAGRNFLSAAYYQDLAAIATLDPD